MKALVLAAGLGSRLSRWTPALPKPFAPVANRPVLAWVLDHLDTAGVEGIGVVVPSGSLALYEKAFGTRTMAGTPVTWLAEYTALGTGGSLRDQSAFFAGAPAVVVPADIVSGVDLAALIGHHARAGAAVTVAAVPRDGEMWEGDVLIPDPDMLGRAAAYAFKPHPRAGTRMGSTGAWVVDPAVLPYISEGFCDFSSEVLPRLTGLGLTLGLFAAGEGVYLRDIGTPAKLLTGNQEAVRGFTPAAPLPLSGPAPRVGDGARVGAHVVIGPGARVGPGASIVGPSVIGANAELGAGAVVTASVLLPGARVPAGARIDSDVVGTGEQALEALLAYAPFGGTE
ncbi:sugar phosphate nucleotidyltransferase [Streptomyces sp. NPDC015032]|uniref:sugar phosphate nucleotidyltransferase n=1 Tax=Streptomyces sp. NPDC015032 TaxID=3364937 RepID=UPI0036F80312